METVPNERTFSAYLCASAIVLQCSRVTSLCVVQAAEGVP